MHTSGFFGDLPFFGPVENSAFFNEIASHGLHKLSETLMTNPRSLEYFVRNDGNSLHKHLEKSQLSTSGKNSKKGNAFSFPTLKAVQDSAVPCLEHNFCQMSVKEVPSRKIDSSRHSEEHEFAELNFYGLEKTWTSLLKHGYGVRSCKKITFRNVDINFCDESGAGQFFLSLLLRGVSSIAFFFNTRTQSLEEVAPVVLELEVLATEDGKNTGDAIQFFVETSCALPVSRVFCSDIEDFATSPLVSVEVLSTASLLDVVCEAAVDKHEELCDEIVQSGDDTKLIAPVILVVVPRDRPIRETLQKRLLDSYSSEPVRVACDNSWSVSSFDRNTPVMFMCSSSWLAEQCCMPAHDQLLARLRINYVIHCGFCERGVTLTEELANVLPLIENNSPGVSAVVFQRTSVVFSRQCIRNPEYLMLPGVSNAILLLFRRVLMRYSANNRQPFMLLTPNMFVSDRAWEVYAKAIEKLTLIGAVRKIEEITVAPVVELSVLGRFLSSRFRIANVKEWLPELSPQDVKIILWGHLFRQSQATIQKLISENHLFNDWVSGRLTEFCSLHNLSLLDNLNVKRESLIRQLASFGLSTSTKDETTGNRVHYVLSIPYGKRTPLSLEKDRPPSTTSRGWYDQAPLRVGISAEKCQVSVFCQPSLGLYCQLSGPEEETTRSIQCPTEISYPLIIAHIALHTSLHNNCVFLESPMENSVVPLPQSLLHSHTMNAILDCEGFQEVGLWVDGVLSEKTLAPSDPSMLDHLLGRSASYITYCERAPFQRKRKRTETTGSAPAAEKDEFQGVKPRSAIEEEAVDDFIKLVTAVGRDKAENSFKGRKGFGFLDPSHELHPFYLHALKAKK